jgi:hypothetical protein
MPPNWVRITADSAASSWPGLKNDASAYDNVDRFFSWVEPNQLALIVGADYPESARTARLKAMTELRYVAMFGWNSRVRQAADVLIDAVNDLSGALAAATYGNYSPPDLRDDPSETPNRLDERVDAGMADLHEYSEAVVGEDH